jgi:hypothetical protein
VSIRFKVIKIFAFSPENGLIKKEEEEEEEEVFVAEIS